MSDCLYSNDDRDAAVYGTETFPELFNTLRGIREFFQGIADFDLHSGNYMADENGAPVIIDPVSFIREDGENMAEGDYSYHMRKKRDRGVQSAPRPIDNPLLSTRALGLGFRAMWDHLVGKQAELKKRSTVKHLAHFKWDHSVFLRQDSANLEAMVVEGMRCIDHKEPLCKPIINGSKAHLQSLHQKPEVKPSKLLTGMVRSAVKSGSHTLKPCLI